MPLDPGKKDLTVAVIGTGTMGRGIMQVSAQGGMRVIAYDEKEGAAEAARGYVAGMLAKLADKGTLSKADADAAAARITVASRLEDLAKADLVVEAIVERLDVKQPLFARLDEMCGPDTIIASNTSSLPITAIAAKCRTPERVGGMHFFNPVPLMKLVEIIPGVRTAQWVSAALTTIARRMTREPVLCTDSPGFIVNHIGRAYVPESARILSDGIALYHEIDRVMCGAPGFRLGPFGLIDMVGADVSVAVMESIWGQYFMEPMYAPQQVLKPRVDAGMYGQKTGAGWYAYKDGKRVEPPAAAPPTVLPKAVWLPGADVEGRKALAELVTKAGVPIADEGDTPRRNAIAIVNPIGMDLTTAISTLDLDPARTVAVDTLFGLKGPRTLMVSPATEARVREEAHALLAADGQSVVVVNDSPGFVAQRVVAQIVNVACQIAQRGIASPADIDKGAKLGLGYPFGPLEWGDRIGPNNVLGILESLHEFYGEPRYRPSPWLKRRAMLGLSLTAPDRGS